MKFRPDDYPGEVLHTSIDSENCQSYEQFDRIDWVAATPSWASIVVGVIFPILAMVAVVFTIDVILCWVLVQWIGYFGTVPLWLVATMALPLALIGAVGIAKIFITVSSKLGNAEFA